MIARRLVCSLVLGAAFGAPALVRAQAGDAPDCVETWGPSCDALLEGAEDAEYAATAEVDAPIAAAHPGDPTATGTTISLRDRAFPGEELVDVLPEVPGVRLQALGGPGQFVGVRLRGGTYDQTTVLLDDMPVSSPDLGAFDLSVLPVWALERVEVYRGDAPVWLGNGAIGGVVRLVPRVARGNRVDLRASGGSFGTYQAAGGLSIATPTVSLVSAVELAGTRGDYPFPNDNLTPFEPNDDFLDRRRNAQSLRGSVLLGGTVRLDAGTIDSTVLLVGRQGGAPGPDRKGQHTHHTLQQLYANLGYTREGSVPTGVFRLQARVGMGFERRLFDDPYGEIGLDRDSTDDRAYLPNARVAGSVDLAEHLELVQVASVQVFRVEPYDVFETIRVPGSRRIVLDEATELRVHGGDRVRWEVRPSARVTLSRGEIHFEHLNVREVERADHVAPTFRVASVVAPTRYLAVRASGHYGVRFPSMRELFGDRQSLLPSPELDPERSLGADLGASICLDDGIVEATLDLTVAVDRRYDLIQLEYNSQNQAIADNLGSAWIATAELFGRTRVTDHVRADFQLTYFTSRTELGAALTFQPALSAFVRAEAGTGAIRARVDDLALYAEVLHVGSVFTDKANLERIDPRTLFTFGARALLFSRSLAASFEVANAFDRVGLDYQGFLLPGRRFAGQLEYRKEF